MRRKSRVSRIRILRNLLLVVSTACLALLGSNMQAQTAAISPASAIPSSARSRLQSSAVAGRAVRKFASLSAPQSGAGIAGTVTAPDGNVIVGALVTLVSKPSKSQQTALTDGEGSFHFPGLPAGTFQITVTASGFAPWVGHDIALSANQQYQVPEISLEIASASTTVHAVFTGHDLAEQQMHLEEKQRVLGVFPNFYTSYVWKAEPLTAGAEVPACVADIDRSCDIFSQARSPEFSSGTTISANTARGLRVTQNAMAPTMLTASSA